VVGGQWVECEDGEENRADVHIDVVDADEVILNEDLALLRSRDWKISPLV
jgi:hypothetical protein